MTRGGSKPSRSSVYVRPVEVAECGHELLAFDSRDRHSLLNALTKRESVCVCVCERERERERAQAGCSAFTQSSKSTNNQVLCKIALEMEYTRRLNPLFHDIILR